MAGFLQRDILDLAGAGETRLSSWIARLGEALPCWFRHIWVDEPPLIFVRVLEEENGVSANTAQPRRKASLWRTAPVVACLPSSSVLIRRLRLPDASLRDLREIVRNDLDRLVPLPPDRIYYDVRQTGDPDDDGIVDVALRVLRRRDLDAARAELARSGLEANAFAIADGWQDYRRSTFDFERRTPVLYMIRKWASPLLLLLVLGLAVTFLLASIHHNDGVIVRLERDLATRKPLVERQIETQKGLAETEKEFSGKVLNRQHHMAIAALNDIARILPNSAVVEIFEFNKGLIRIRGEAKDGGALVPLLSGNPFFSDVKLSSPLTTIRAAGDREGQRERFDIELRPVSSSSGTERAP